ncbi:MAG TPA: cytochrome c3 family protein, partial [Gemmataceae bacterium]|nr:cytochrome c3 family protein [Gemmataceae bacterium]
MSHSIAPVAHGTPDGHDDSYVLQSFQAAGYDYIVEHRGSVVVHRETRRDAAGKVVAEAEGEVQFTIGSGAHGKTYVVQHGDCLFQSPISWYAAAQSMGLAPSHRQKNLHFERRIDGNCLFCHCDDARPVEHTLNRFQGPISSRYGIGCERCHGPGELHVQRYKRGGIRSGADDTIVNPRRLEPNLREAVCEQCHLQGARRVLRRGRQLHDYRPGLRLQDYWTVFVQQAGPEELQKAVSQVEQLHESRCFRESKGELGCISCHNPHAVPRPADRVAIFRARCLNCHQDSSCREAPERRLARTAADDCTACHMPRRRSSDIAHAAITDHRILRRPPTDSRAQESGVSLRDDMPVPFYPETRATHSSDLDRDLG